MKILTIVGTRPEAVKMAPVLRALASRLEVTSLIADTGQHRHMLAGHLDFFGLAADFNLDLMRPGEMPLVQAARMSNAIGPLIAAVRPQLIIVQGDTSSALAGARAAVSYGVPVAHVEAGLRTHRDLPWPEEAFRCEIDRLSDQLFAPTALAAANLRTENHKGRISVTGNSGVDALQFALDRLDTMGRHDECRRRNDPPLILATLHRRENIGPGTRALCSAIDRVARGGTAQVIMPLHPNPAVASTIHAALGNCPAVRLVPPLDYPNMVSCMRKADLIVTDSGGLQEEAPTLGKRVLILRDATERPEGLALGLAQLVSLESEAIVSAIADALAQPQLPAMDNPYGDGCASARIVSALLDEPFVPFAAQEMPAIPVAV